MQNFKRAAFAFLIATDVAARGIDVNDLELVVNYDLPYDAEDYVHRIGRTGRDGKKGKAVTLVSGAAIYKLQSIERFLRTKIRREQVPSLAAVEDRRSDALFDKITATIEGGEFARRAPLVERLLEQGHTPTDVAAAILHHFAPASQETVEVEPVHRPEQRRPHDRGDQRDRDDRRPGPGGRYPKPRKFAPVNGPRFSKAPGTKKKGKPPGGKPGK
jgi:ATP-dependent RNA helicase DeaD